MGLLDIFKRHEEVPVVEKRSGDATTENTTTSGYTVPVGISFLTEYLNKQRDITKLSAGFAAIDLISSKIASIPIVVREGSKYGPVIEHSFNHVFDTTLVSKFITMKQLVWDTLVHGNGLAYIKRAGDGSVKEIVYIPWGDYTISYNSLKQELYYLIPKISKKKIEPVNVIHIIKNTDDGVNGKAIAFYAGNSIYLAATTDKSAASFFDNGCAVSGLLKSSKYLSTEAKLDAKNSWMEALGPGKSGGVAVLGNDMTYEAVGSSSSDSQMLESRQFNVREIARFLGIPPELIGDDTNKAYNSLSQAIDALITFTLSPFISVIEEEFNRKCLKPSERTSYVIDFNEEELRMTDETAQAQALNSLVAGGIMTPNEARKKINLPPIDGGDELRQPEETIDNEVQVDENQ